MYSLVGKKHEIELHDIDIKLYSDEEVTLDLSTKLLLKRIDPSQLYFTKYHVDRDCSLKKFVNEKDLEFRRGCAFYEFKQYSEDISKDKEVVLMCEVL